MARVVEGFTENAEEIRRTNYGVGIDIAHISVMYYGRNDIDPRSERAAEFLDTRISASPSWPEAAALPIVEAEQPSSLFAPAALAR